MFPPKEMIWITWERHRRTNELSRALGVQLFTLLYPGNYLGKVFVLSLETVSLLVRLHTRRVIAQNPSMVLSALLCFLKPFFGYKVIVDRHSNFKFETQDSPKLKYRVFHYLGRYTVRKADLTIVTNEFLKGIVQKWGGRGFVLQDKPPELPYGEANPPQLAGRHNITYICSFSDDEPVEEVLGAARLLGADTAIYITGDQRRFLEGFSGVIPGNIVFTGFLSERDFQSLLGASDAIVVLTKDEHLLLCGAYEAVSLGKPLVLSNTRSLRDYFQDGPVFVDNQGPGIAEAVRYVIEHKDKAALGVRQLRARLNASWAEKFNELVSFLRRLRLHENKPGVAQFGPDYAPMARVK